MKKRTVTLLWLIALALGVTVYFVKFHQAHQKTTRTQLTPGDKILPTLPIRELTQVTLHQGKDTTTLIHDTKNQWHIQERSNYPANHELLRNLLGALKELRVTQGYPCTSEYFGRFGLASESSEPSDRGLCITMTTDKLPKAAEVFLGKYNGATRTTMGRFIRFSSDTSGAYAVGETFPGIYADPPAWLDKTFFSIKNIQSIHLTAPNDPDFQSWKIARASTKPKDQFLLTDLKANEIMQLTSTGKLRHLFAINSFQDVLSNTEVKKTSHPDSKLKRQVVITTFDNLTYTVTYWPQIAQKQPEIKTEDTDSPLPSVQASFILTVELQGELPTPIRTPSPDETPEQTQALDQFYENIKINVPLTRTLKNRHFKVGYTMLDLLKKSRQDFITTKSLKP